MKTIKVKCKAKGTIRGRYNNEECIGCIFREQISQNCILKANIDDIKIYDDYEIFLIVAKENSIKITEQECVGQNGCPSDCKFINSNGCALQDIFNLKVKNKIYLIQIFDEEVK